MPIALAAIVPTIPGTAESMATPAPTPVAVATAAAVPAPTAAAAAAAADAADESVVLAEMAPAATVEDPSKSEAVGGAEEDVPGGGGDPDDDGCVLS